MGSNVAVLERRVILQSASYRVTKEPASAKESGAYSSEICAQRAGRGSVDASTSRRICPNKPKRVTDT